MKNSQWDNTVINPQAVLVMAKVEKTDNIELDLDELENLAKTASIDVVGRVWQKRDVIDSKYVVGEGKIDEVKTMIESTGADMVIFDNVLNGSKINNLELKLGVKVIDRSMLILDIFAMRATSSEGKLQVELAQLKNSLPKLASLNGTESRFGGGVGMRGPGESKLELKKRVVVEKIQKLEKQLTQVKKARAINREQRHKSKYVVSLVGYTNSGKSTLMNLLTKEKLYAKDELFATLDTTTRNLWLDNETEILLVDTVGFINKLPHEFISAFSATLEEAKYADLLIHVVDISNPNYEKQMQVVKDVLSNIGTSAPMITVYNKIDKLSNLDINNPKPDTIYISSKKGLNIANLKNLIIEKINQIRKISID